jgi:hypothetical protein
MRKNSKLLPVGLVVNKINSGNRKAPFWRDFFKGKRNLGKGVNSRGF